MSTESASALGNELSTLAREMSDLARAMSEGLENGMHTDRVTQFAARAVPGAEHAGIATVHGRHRPVTVASSGPLPEEVDALQYDLREGPALEALTISDIVWVPDLAADLQYPRFAPRAVEATGVRSMLSFRLFLTSERRAALSFYATKPDAFPDIAMPLGAIFAAYASLTLTNTLHNDKVIHLERAVESNREIGVAIGILMARELHTQDEAFDRLRAASQHLHRKLRDVADEVKQTGTLPKFR
jgi:hypothetical protein